MMSQIRLPRARATLVRAIDAGAFPAASVEVGRCSGVVWREAFGRLEGDPRSPATTETIFDLASLTKVLATTAVVMRLCESGRLDLDDPVERWIDEWRGHDRAHVTVRDLLAHASGLTAHLPLYRDCEGRREFESAICGLPLEYPPRTRSVYSDLGFMLLAFLAENAAGERFDRQYDRLRADLGEPAPVFRPPREWRDRIAPTGVDGWRGRLLAGEVNDQNAWALGGVAGHAGLFGTADAVGRFARSILLGLRESACETTAHLAGLPVIASPATVRLFATRTTIPRSSRALGWDTMLPTSSCGRRMSPTAIGHTGFTGTSLWIDWEADLYAVLLTNRVHPDAGNEAILDVRPAFHDAMIEELVA
jgi:CubicO group peptidase (beta-lactamase class C family)